MPVLQKHCQQKFDFVNCCNQKCISEEEIPTTLSLYKLITPWASKNTTDLLDCSLKEKQPNKFMTSYNFKKQEDKTPETPKQPVKPWCQLSHIDPWKATKREKKKLTRNTKEKRKKDNPFL